MQLAGKALLLAAATGAAMAVVVALSCGPEEIAHEQPWWAEGPDAVPPVILDGGGEIPPPPNGEEHCAAGACNYQSQSGCPGEQACRPQVSDGGTVQPACHAAGPRDTGEACSDWNDCARGQLCAEGVCRRLCCGGDWSACSEDESCIRQLLAAVGDAAVNAGVDLCTAVGICDVFDAASCASEPGRNCQIVDPRGKVACMPEGDAAEGDECDRANPCAAGLFCLDTDPLDGLAEGICRRLCRAVQDGEPSCPDPADTCVHYNRDPRGVGECTPY